MSDVELTNKMPLEDVQKTPEYARLTPKQRLWVSTYIQDGMEHGDYNPIHATKTAFACKTEDGARIFSYSVLANIHVIEVLNLHFRLEPIEAFIKLIDRAISNKKITHAQVQALRLKCELQGILNRLPVFLNDAESGPRISEQVEKAIVVPAQSLQHRKRGRPRKNPEKPKVEPPTDFGPYGLRKKTS